MKNKAVDEDNWSLLDGIKQTPKKLLETVKKNPWKSILATASLFFPPVGTVIGATVIGSVVGQKVYETHNEQQDVPVTKLGFWSGLKQTAGKVFSVITEHPWKSSAVAVGLLLYPIGTAISASVIGGMVGKKNYETHKEYEAEQKASGNVKPRNERVAQKDKNINVESQQHLKNWVESTKSAASSKDRWR